MTDEIRAALSKLDASNDNHWTESGQPRLDALGLTPMPKRSEVTEAAPLFNRNNMVLPAAAPAPVAAPAVEAKPEGDGGLSAIQAEVDAAEKNVLEATAKHDAAQRELAVAQQKFDIVNRKLAKVKDPNENIKGIRAVLDRSKQERAEKAAIAKELRSVGVTAKLLQTGSALDQAMARKRGFGLQRPNLQAQGK